MEGSGSRVDIGRVFSETFSTYGQYAAPLLGGALIVIGVASVINGLLASSGSFVLYVIGALIGIAASFLYTGYVVKLVQDVRDGRLDQSVGGLFSAAAPYLGTLVLNGILAGIAIAIGFVLLVVPGLILITIWAVIAPSIVVEGQGVFEAFGRSRELVRGEGWTVFAIIVLAYIAVFAVGFIGGSIGFAIGDNAGRLILQVIIQIALAPVLALVASILFFDLGGGTGAATAPGAPAA